MLAKTKSIKWTILQGTVSFRQSVKGNGSNLQDEEQEDNGRNLRLANRVGHRITLGAKLVEEECAVDVACLIDDGRRPIPEETASNGQNYCWYTQREDDKLNGHEKSGVKAFANKEE